MNLDTNAANCAAKTPITIAEPAPNSCANVSLNKSNNKQQRQFIPSPFPSITFKAGVNINTPLSCFLSSSPSPSLLIISIVFGAGVNEASSAKEKI